MPSEKSGIKSKKEKLLQKKFSKGKSNLIDLIENSQEDIKSQNIQKRSKYSGKSISQQKYQKNKSQEQPVNNDRPFNLINFDRLKKDPQMSMPPNAANQIFSGGKRQNSNKTHKKQIDSFLCVVQQDQHPEDSVSAAVQRSLYSYKLMAKDGLKYISQNYHKGRVDTEIESIEEKQKRQDMRLLAKMENQNKLLQQEQQNQDQVSLIKKDGNQIKQVDQIQEQNQPQQEQTKKFKKVPRYFLQPGSGDQDDQQQDNIVKCYRCNKKGHIAKNCPQEAPPIRCNFCQKQHHFTTCESNICYRCGQPGHISQDCTSTAIQCKRCKKRGHKSGSCQVPIFLDYHLRKQDELKERFKLSDLKKLKCMNEKNCQQKSSGSKGVGHFNCFVYGSCKSPQPYEQMIKQNDSFERQSQNFVIGGGRPRPHSGNRNRSDGSSLRNSFNGYHNFRNDNYHRYDRYNQQRTWYNGENDINIDGHNSSNNNRNNCNNSNNGYNDRRNQFGNHNNRHNNNNRNNHNNNNGYQYERERNRSFSKSSQHKRW